MPNTITITNLRNTIAKSMSAGQSTVLSVATELGTSPRTLQRRISELGVTFSHLVDEVRCEKACVLLRDPTRKISDIASTLGYKDAGSFTRAFERWMGIVPQSYRNQIRTLNN